MTRATKAELRQEIAELRHVGAQMANLCFNIGQLCEVKETHLDAMRELFVQWDAIKRREELNAK